LFKLQLRKCQLCLFFSFSCRAFFRRAIEKNSFVNYVCRAAAAKPVSTGKAARQGAGKSLLKTVFQ
jgi:hypothetical protein